MGVARSEASLLSSALEDAGRLVFQLDPAEPAPERSPREPEDRLRGGVDRESAVVDVRHAVPLRIATPDPRPEGEVGAKTLGNAESRTLPEEDDGEPRPDRLADDITNRDARAFDDEEPYRRRASHPFVQKTREYRPEAFRSARRKSIAEDERDVSTEARLPEPSFARRGEAPSEIRPPQVSAASLRHRGKRKNFEGSERVDERRHVESPMNGVPRPRVIEGEFEMPRRREADSRSSKSDARRCRRS